MKIKKKTLLTILVSLGILISPGVISHIHADMVTSHPVQTASQKQPASGKQEQPAKSTANSQNDKQNGFKISSPSKLNGQRQNQSEHQNIQNRLHLFLTVNNPAHYDNNRRQIGGMNRFAKQRTRFYYPQISFNTRDLGGYVTANGRYQVKPDRIIRSAKLQGLSSQGAKTLKKLRVRQDVDLRFPDQIKKRPDPGEPKSNQLDGTKIKIQNDPVYSAHEDTTMHHGVHINGEWYFYGRPAVDRKNAIKAYRRVFKVLLSNHRGAILYHCDVGRDRTGVVSALILSSLGVKRNVIFHDYLLTNYYRRKNGMNAVPYNQQAGELKHFFDTIDHQNGNVNRYLQKVIGLKHTDMKKLRSMYLEPIRH